MQNTEEVLNPEEVLEMVKNTDTKDLARKSFEATERVQDAISKLTDVIKEEQPYLAAVRFSICVAFGVLGTPDVEHPDREHPGDGYGIMPVKFVAGSESDCIALTNVLTAQIYDARKIK